MIFGLNILELVIGAVFGFVPIIWIRWGVILTVPACAFLWAWSGAGHGNFWRRMVMPGIVVASIFMARQHWQVLISWPIMWGVLSIGYGIPSTMPQDPGSWLGRFWWNRTEGDTEKEHQDKAELLTRITIYALLALSFIPAFL